MAVTLPARAGTLLSFRVRYWNEDKTVLVPTEGYTARLQLRATQRNGRVILTTSEYTGTLPAPAGTVLTRVADGDWRVTLGGSITRSIPSSVLVEMELVNDSDPEDVRLLFDGKINTRPQGVANE